jgi:chromosome segregation ATPase
VSKKYLDNVSVVAPASCRQMPPRWRRYIVHPIAGHYTGLRKRIRNSGEDVTEPNQQFEQLEEKLLKVIELFKRTQAEKRTLEQEVEKLKGDTKERAQGFSSMERELIALRREREDVRSRVEKLLERIDALTSSDSENSD